MLQVSSTARHIPIIRTSTSSLSIDTICSNGSSWLHERWPLHACQEYPQLMHFTNTDNPSPVWGSLPIYLLLWLQSIMILPFWVHSKIISIANHHYLRCSYRTVIWWINDSIWLQYNCQHYPTPTHPNPAKQIWAKMHTSLQTSFWQMGLSAISNHTVRVPCF